MFLGATIHDVAQVVGAGYAVSRETGDTATVVKLMRVAMLCRSSSARRRSRECAAARSGPQPAVAAVVCGRVHRARRREQHWLGRAGRAATRQRAVTLVSRHGHRAIGMKTELKQLVSVGLRPIALMIGETVFLAGLTLVLLRMGA